MQLFDQRHVRALTAFTVGLMFDDAPGREVDRIVALDDSEAGKRHSSTDLKGGPGPPQPSGSASPQPQSSSSLTAATATSSRSDVVPRTSIHGTPDSSRT